MIARFVAALLRAMLNVLTFGRVSAAEARRNAPGYFSERYRARLASPEWHALRRRVLWSTLGRDLLMPALRASQIDHIGYRRLGRERIWLDVVPLHPATHKLVTALRDAGLRGPVNAMLRLACAGWIAAYLAVAVLVVAIVSGHVGDLLLGIRSLALRL